MAAIRRGQYSFGLGVRVGYNHPRKSRNETDIATGRPRSRSSMGTLSTDSTNILSASGAPLPDYWSGLRLEGWPESQFASFWR